MFKKIKFKRIKSLIKYGKLYVGINKKPIWSYDSMWCDGEHWILHLGYVYIGFSH